MKVESLTDVVNALQLDCYKRCFIEDFDKHQDEIDRTTWDRTNALCDKIIIDNKTYKNQPEDIKFFLPPLEEIAMLFHTTLREENKGREIEESKRKKEELINFSFTNNILIALYKNKGNYVYYTYSYDYKEKNEVVLMSRVEYK